MTSDGLTLVFGSDRAGGLGYEDLWFTERETLGAPWSAAQHFGRQVNSDRHDGCPCLSNDGLTLLFTSKRSGGFGEDDIWIARRESVNDVFRQPVNAGGQVNTKDIESHPWLSPDGLTLLFTAVGVDGYGGYDLWFSTRLSDRDEFGSPVNAGPKVNSTADEAHGSLSPDGSILYFESDRADGFGWHDIWMSRRVPQKAASEDVSTAGALIETKSDR